MLHNFLFFLCYVLYWLMMASFYYTKKNLNLCNCANGNSAVLCFANSERCLSYRTHSSIYNPSHCLTFHDTFTFCSFIISLCLYVSLFHILMNHLPFCAPILPSPQPSFFCSNLSYKMSFIQLKFHHLTSSTHTLTGVLYILCVLQMTEHNLIYCCFLLL